MRPGLPQRGVCSIARYVLACTVAPALACALAMIFPLVPELELGNEVTNPRQFVWPIHRIHARGAVVPTSLRVA